VVVASANVSDVDVNVFIIRIYFGYSKNRLSR
jgi:hypothetical protein